MEKIKFLLAGCDISLIAEAPADMTVKQLLDQASKINTHWCACGLHYLHPSLSNVGVEVSFDYGDIHKVDEDAPFDIKSADDSPYIY